MKFSQIAPVVSFQYDKITLWTCPKSKKERQHHKILVSPGFCPDLLKIRPDTALIFTKMSPDEDLVTLCRLCLRRPSLASFCSWTCSRASWCSICRGSTTSLLLNQLFHLQVSSNILRVENSPIMSNFFKKLLQLRPGGWGGSVMTLTM